MSPASYMKVYVRVTMEAVRTISSSHRFHDDASRLRATTNEYAPHHLSACFFTCTVEQKGEKDDKTNDTLLPQL